VFPFFTGNARLAQNAGQQIPPNISLMGIGNADSDILSHHEGMLSARPRAIEPQSSQIADQIVAANWADPWHD
jgi:hypothetical protein